MNEMDKMNSTQVLFSTGNSGSIESDPIDSAGSFILAQNNFASTFTPLTASAEAMALPGIKGSGWVRDLQEVNDGEWRRAA